MDTTTAMQMGYTQEITAANDHGCEFRLLVRPGDDLDGVYSAWDMDEMEFVRINGWMFSF